jgi:methionyl-tRNA formyltransferase
MEGIPGLFEVARRRMGFDGGDSRENGAVVELNPAVGRITVTDFHSPVCMQTLCGLHADLGVLAGTYILRDTVFALPRYGSINLHTGKLPEYRGSAPAFWEMYNGEPEVGITIHQVESELDAGGVYQQERFPLDLAPRMDPMSYIARYREETLVPNGIRMVTSTVAMIADGNAVCVPQDSARARTYRMPNYNAIKELRRRVRARRKSAEGDAR